MVVGRGKKEGGRRKRVEEGRGERAAPSSSPAACSPFAYAGGTNRRPQTRAGRGGHRGGRLSFRGRGRETQQVQRPPLPFFFLQLTLMIRRSYYLMASSYCVYKHCLPRTSLPTLLISPQAWTRACASLSSSAPTMPASAAAAAAKSRSISTTPSSPCWVRARATHPGHCSLIHFIKGPPEGVY